MTSAAESKAIARLADLEEPDAIRRLLANARRMNSPEVEEAALRRLNVVQADGEPGTAENALWQGIHAIEQMKSEEAGKTIRLSYLRRDIQKLGIIPAIDKLVSKTGPSERFVELTGRGMLDLTAEAIVERFPDQFSAEAVERSQTRLAEQRAAP